MKIRYRLILGVVFALLACRVLTAAIAPDASADGANCTSCTSLTWSHTITGSNPIGWAWAYTSGGDNLTGVTFNGVAATQATKLACNGAEQYLYYITGQTGAHNWVASAGSSVTIYGVSQSYTGAKQSQSGGDIVTQTSCVTGSQNPFAVTLTTSVDNSWTVLGYESDGGAAGTGGTGTTRRQVNSAYNGIAFYDSNAAITPAASTTLNVTGPVTANSGLMASFAPDTGGGGGGGSCTGRRLLLGVGKC